MNIINHFKIIVIVSLLIALSSSSFFYPRYIQNKITTNTLNSNDVIFATEHLHLPVILHAFHQSLIYSNDWLRYAYILANEQGDVAFELAQYFKLHSKSINTTSLDINRYQQQYEYWLSRSVQHQYVPAIEQLAAVFFEQGQYEKAQRLLKLYYNESQLLALALTQAISKGDIKRINNLASKVDNDATLLSLQHKIKTYFITSKKSFTHVIERDVSLNNAPEICSNSIQFYATNLVDLQKADNLIKRVATDPLSKHFCFLPVRYVSLPDLHCTHQNTEVIQCNEEQWPNGIKNDSAKYLVMLLPNGGANVHKGIMYLDNNDTIDVFTHELSHFLGFVDEYPLVKGHSFCQVESVIKAPNIVVLPRYWFGEKEKIRNQVLTQLPWRSLIKKHTQILKKVIVSELPLKQQRVLPKYMKELKNGDNYLWVLGTFDRENDSVGVYQALTCEKNKYENHDNIPLQSFKSLYKSTSLEYFELPMPALYLKTIEKSRTVFSMKRFSIP